MSKKLCGCMLIACLLLSPAVTAFGHEIETHAASAILLDAVTGEILYAKDEHTRRAPASLTKIMTLVVTFEAIKNGDVKPDDRVMASEKAASLGGTQVYARPGEVFPLSEWILAVAVGSANDASAVVAEHVGGTEQAFARLMNEKAEALGMKNTHFANSHGLDAPEHYTTAADLGLLARHAVTIPELLLLTSTYQAKFRNDTFGLDNVNKMVRFYTGCDGLKTGRTQQSKYCLVATAQRDDQRFIAVVLGAETSDERFSDGNALLDHGFSNYRSVVLAPKGHIVDSARVWGGAQSYVSAVPLENVAVLLPKSQKHEPTEHIAVTGTLKAPVLKGDVVGTISVTLDGEELVTASLVAASDTPRASVGLSLLRMLAEITRLHW